MLIVQRPQIEEQVVSDVRSQFIVEPLEPGFGYTLGNTLRRTLLSRVPGAAVTSMQIEGVKHEFTTVSGVVEDVVDIILNLKQLVVRMEEGELHEAVEAAGACGRDVPLKPHVGRGSGRPSRSGDRTRTSEENFSLQAPNKSQRRNLKPQWLTRRGNG